VLHKHPTYGMLHRLLSHWIGNSCQARWAVAHLIHPNPWCKAARQLASSCARQLKMAGQPSNACNHRPNLLPAVKVIAQWGQPQSRARRASLSKQRPHRQVVLGQDWDRTTARVWPCFTAKAWGHARFWFEPHVCSWSPLDIHGQLV